MVAQPGRCPHRGDRWTVSRAGIMPGMNAGHTRERSLQVVIYREGDGFVAQCLNVDVASDGATEAEARANILEALELYFDEPAAEADYQPVGDAHVEHLTLQSA
jgi:predicted RNase H-like HicB family nuclease